MGGKRGSGAADAGQDWRYPTRMTRDHGRRLPRSIVTFTICVPEPGTAEGHRYGRDLGYPRERRHAAGPDFPALSLTARRVVGSIESHLFTPEDHCPQTLRTVGFSSGSAFDRDSRGRCAGDASRT